MAALAVISGSLAVQISQRREAAEAKRETRASSTCETVAYKKDGDCDEGNNNAGCEFDGGDCCGDSVVTTFCTVCECKDPSSPTYGKTYTSDAADPFGYDDEYSGYGSCSETGQFCDTFIGDEDCCSGLVCCDDGSYAGSCENVCPENSPGSEEN
jgi:hypothetical protein